MGIGYLQTDLAVGLLLAIALFPALFGLHTLLIFLTKAPDRGVALMFRSFVVYMVTLAGYVYLQAVNDVLTWMSVLSAGLFFCLGYMEFFSLVVRGFSLHLMSTLYFSKRSMSTKELMTAYASGHGMDWLVEKRLRSMEAVSLIRRDTKMIEIGSPKARMIGHFGIQFKKFLRMGSGG